MQFLHPKVTSPLTFIGDHQNSRSNVFSHMLYTCLQTSEDAGRSNTRQAMCNLADELNAVMETAAMFIAQMLESLE